MKGAERGRTRGAVPPVRLRNLVAAAAGLQASLDELARRQPPPAADDPAVLGVLAQARARAEAVEALCAGRGSSPAGLPAQSCRAYQWLKFLSEPAQLLDAAAALRTLQDLLAQAVWPRRRSIVGQPVRLEIYPTAYLYRMRPQAGGVRVSIAPGYVGAPPDVLAALLRTALGYARRPAKHLLHAYAAGPDFAEMTMALEVSTEPPAGSLRGQHYDLDEVFQRVNAAYFAGQLARPRLAWSRAANGRLLGYYQGSTDRLMLSQALDDRRVPASAVDLVMYHELLHKHLGVQIVNGRHYAHTEAFRQAEQRFQGYEAVKAVLDGLAARPPLSTPGRRAR